LASTKGEEKMKIRRSGLAAQQIAEPKNETSECFLTRGELAKRWNCSTHTIARRKDISPVRFGRRFLRYRLRDITEVEGKASGVFAPKDQDTNDLNVKGIL
jgi:hypothetical protein